MAISEVKLIGNYYHVFDEDGRKITQYQSSIGELKGFNSKYIVFLCGSIVTVCDEKFRRISQSSQAAMGEFLNITDKIHCKRGGYIVTYDEHLNQISQRQDLY